jgi:hypothetical protein
MSLCVGALTEARSTYTLLRGGSGGSSFCALWRLGKQKLMRRLVLMRSRRELGESGWQAGGILVQQTAALNVWLDVRLRPSVRVYVGVCAFPSPGLPHRPCNAV